ncbi:hypothetical protein AVMA1855_03845 [Acidovorax sp. SUPP1855]|uniref:hypothetical protein n=1 Tax=Acidovorax sp. SUPP1855 TaxID=431774 RepID=UPI0023DE6623|nr:hypothetical protein [Acidovorax sp. SUPP1855]GKS83243.1 hypothetical protein AVMA1855_03845 [Acidovorax sp. SUPP1855]
MNAQALAALVPPLRGCALCMHSTRIGEALHCNCPAVRKVFGLQPVHVVRQTVGACGPGAAHMHMDAWGAQV